jgi:hypothetical protein
VRSILSWVALLIAAGSCVFWWQRSQIVALRAQLARQGDALADNQKQVEGLSLLLVGAGRKGMTPSPGSRALRRTDATGGVLRADERRIILDQYRNVIAEMNLPDATASRLRYLLEDRIEAVLDAEDAAVQEGFAEGSAETARAVTLAIADVDRDIASLVGRDGIRRLDGLPVMVSPAPAVVPEPAAPTTVVSVVIQAPAMPAYAEAAESPSASDTYALSSPYLYYFPVVGAMAGPGVARGFGGIRPPGIRPHREFTHFPIR